MAFVNRRRELQLLETLAQATARAYPARHLALTGVRRIGKSEILRHFVSTHPDLIVVALDVDKVVPTFRHLFLAFIRAGLDAYLRSARLELLSQFMVSASAMMRAASRHPGLSDLVGHALEAADQRTARGEQLLESAITFPEEMARVLGQPVVVFADEFQNIMKLAGLAPFGHAGRRPGATASEHFLGVLRASIEHRPHVGWVVTGSSISMLRSMLGGGPLMGRFDEHVVEPFDTETTDNLARTIWRDEQRVEWTEHGLSRVFRLTQGHPFYADVVCRNGASAAHRLEQPVSASMVDGAFVDAVQQPQGQIAIACSEMNDSLEERTPLLRGILLCLARDQQLSLSEIAQIMEVQPSNAHRYLQDLRRLGFIRKEGSQYEIVDPVFRYWLACTIDPLAPEPVLLDPRGARRAARLFEEAFLREREQRGALREG